MADGDLALWIPRLYVVYEPPNTAAEVMIRRWLGWAGRDATGIGYLGQCP